MKEWRNIDKFDYYQISNEGDVKSLERTIVTKNGIEKTIKERIITPILNKHTGYLLVGLHYEGRSATKPIHKLVAEAFIPNPDNKPCVDHINGDKTDNRAENLRWVTYKENSNNPLTRQKMIDEVWHNEERIEKIMVHHRGKRVSDEQKRKQSLAMSGEKHPFYSKKRPEHNAKLIRDEKGRFKKKVG